MRARGDLEPMTKATSWPNVAGMRFDHLPGGLASHTLTAFVLVALMATVTACGDSAAPSPDAGANPAQETTSAPGAAQVKPQDLFITAEDLPEGWRDSNSQGTDYRLDVCGVDIEPDPPVSAMSIRFAQGPVGPFLEQHVRVYESDTTPAQVAAALDQALQDCTEYEASGVGPDAPTARFTVQPLDVPGTPSDAVSWRQTTQGDQQIVTDLVMIPQARTMTAFLSYTLQGDPDVAVLQSAVAALPESDS